MRLGGLFLAFILAWTTYRWVEKPIRLGGHQRLKTIALIVLMVIIGFVGYNTYAWEGLKFRKANKINDPAIIDLDPKFTQFISDESCNSLLGLGVPDELVCLTKSDKPEVLIIGDSNAMALNLAPYFHLVDVKTLLLAKNSCVPFESSSLFYLNGLEKSCKDLFKMQEVILN